MDVEVIREFLLSLPHVVETEQWGGLVFWIGDKAVGGKMFARLRLEESGGPLSVASYSVGAERYAELLEIEGIFPAPYMARIYWVAVERWSVFRKAEWEQELRAAHALTLAKLPPKTLAVLAMPVAAQRRVIAERRKDLAAREKQKSKEKPKSK
jgi:predicted DNA-binding protein (MmcQ/YjbR family)